ncbi:glutamate-rich protein 6B [Crotalus adamanteus]|uniref:Glutamate-rich protein 6B n=1 Tax=Crotalus adamanteus TaxID=8729 RepID=A0AAW1BI24_CROAD
MKSFFIHGFVNLKESTSEEEKIVLDERNWRRNQREWIMTYKEVFQCVVQELMERRGSEIDIRPHHLGSLESKTRRMLMENLQERGFERYREIFMQYIKYGPCIKIHFKFSDHPPQPETESLEKRYPEPKELLEMDLGFKAEQLKPEGPLEKRTEHAGPPLSGPKEGKLEGCALHADLTAPHGRLGLYAARPAQEPPTAPGELPPPFLTHHRDPGDRGGGVTRGGPGAEDGLNPPLPGPVWQLGPLRLLSLTKLLLNYPSGRLAILITYERETQFTYSVLRDTKGGEILAFFTNQGYAAHDQPKGRLRLNLDLCRGSVFDEKGQQQKFWSWWDLGTHVHAPPFQPVCLQLNVYIRVKLKAQDQVFLMFMKAHDGLRLNVGARLRVSLRGQEDPTSVGSSSFLSFTKTKRCLWVETQKVGPLACMLKDSRMLWVLQRYGTTKHLVSPSLLEKIGNILTHVKKLLKKLDSDPSKEAADLRLISKVYERMHRRQRQPKERN